MADDKDKTGGGAPPQGQSAASLAAENAALKQKLADLQQTVAAEKGPESGTRICFQRQGEGFCRPGAIASDGFTELLKAPGGATARHALIEYGEAPWTMGANAPAHMQGHSFQTDRPWDPSGKPETWHLPDECPRQQGPGCPYAKVPVWPAPPRRAPQPQAP